MALTDHLEELEPTILIAVGFVLFVFPEPATSALGVGLMLLGIAWWLQEWRAPASTEDGGDGRQAETAPRR